MSHNPSFMRAVLRWLAAGAVVFGLASAVVFEQSRFGCEVSHLSPPDRRTLYLKTLDTLKSSCTGASGQMLKGYCREQAEFISDFAECDDACRALVLQLTVTSPR